MESRTSESSGRRKSINSPSPPLFEGATRATNASLARRGEICSAIWAAVVPRGTSRRAPSGSVICMVSMAKGRAARSGGTSHPRGKSYANRCLRAGSRKLASDKRDIGEISKMCVRCHEAVDGGERGGVDHRVGHGEMSVQTKARGEQSQTLVDGHHASPQRCGEEPVGGRGTLR